MSGYTLSILTYDRGVRWDDSTITKPYHWLFLLTPNTSNTQSASLTYQLHGMPGGFYFSSEEEITKVLSGLKEELEIGNVPVEKIERFRKVLNEVEIVKDESSSWNCQSWCLAALAGLRLEGFIGEDFSDEVIRSWLREK